MSILPFFLVLVIATPSKFPLHQPTSFQSREPSRLTGVYRIDLQQSDKLYSVVAEASSNVPFKEQQRFFVDLAVRFTPPDLLAIERVGNKISLGSSRAPRMTFQADGLTHTTRSRDGHPIRVRFSMENGRLTFQSRGKTEDNFTVVFESLDDGKRLRVTRNIIAEGLDQPLVIRSLYNKVSEVARWELYGESRVAAAASKPAPSRVSESDDSANVLRKALNEWIDATNNRDIDKQMDFYVPRLKAYYLTRNTAKSFVRDEKARVFSAARLIDVRAEEPEIIFQEGGRAAIMRYRKKYRIDSGKRSRKGEVIQELRWQRVGEQWLIFSERDIRVLS